ncbi:MAG TPA: ATP-binding protein, partial [Longimicrobiaceae bacterium]|nr:ATP-binding protein [Longimicrobiaceae bacterium]
HSDRRVEVRVVDDGPGVAQAVRSTLFDPGISTKKGGWGVGLSLARRIVEDVHEGRLYLADSERGATFVMVLPATADPDDPRLLRRPFRVRAQASGAAAAAAASAEAASAAEPEGAETSANAEPLPDTHVPDAAPARPAGSKGRTKRT